MEWNKCLTFCRYTHLLNLESELDAVGHQDVLSLHLDDQVMFGVFGVVCKYIMELSFTIASIDCCEPLDGQVQRCFDYCVFVFFMFFRMLSTFGVGANEAITEVECMHQKHEVVPFFDLRYACLQILNHLLIGVVEVQRNLSHYINQIL